MVDGKMVVHVVSVEVFPVNDAPVLLVPVSVSGKEDQKIVVGGITITDIDLDETPGSLEVHLSAAHGTLDFKSRAGISFLPENQPMTKNVAFVGGLVQSSAVLASLRYFPDKHWYGVDVIHVAVSDQGYTGSGGEFWSNSTIAVTVTIVFVLPHICCFLS